MNRAALLALSLAALSCAVVPLGDGEKRVVVREIATEVILPTLVDLERGARTLSADAERLAKAPSEGRLDAAQEAWRKARAPWKESEAFGFGPATDFRLAVAIDQSPVDTAKIDLEIAGSELLTESYVETLGANRKGFHALEHLLFDGDSASVLESLTTDVHAERRRELLALLARNLETKAFDLREAWDPNGDDYTKMLAEPGGANSSHTTIKSVIDTLVNESVFLSELVFTNKLGKPMGTASGGVPEPDLQESGPSDNSTADMAGNLRSIRNVYLGTRTGKAGGGITKLVAARAPATDRAVRAALEDAIGAVDAIPRPYETALSDQHPNVIAAYAAVKSLKHILATALVAALGATLKFNDNDGD